MVLPAIVGRMIVSEFLKGIARSGGRGIDARGTVKFGVRQSGGQRMEAFLRDTRRNMAVLRQTKITIGFHEPHVARLARIHEFGNARLGVPERAAFRGAERSVIDAVRKVLRAEMRTSRSGGAFELSQSAAQHVADAAARELKLAYLDFSASGSPALARETAERKRGTPGAGKLLVGERGPRLIEHVEGKVSRR